jgi:hypothetical protein
MWYLLRVLCSVVLVNVFTTFGFAGIGKWKTYTAKREIRDLTYDRDSKTIWAATAGGMFSYRLSDETFQEFTTSEGLRTIDLTAITVDDRGAIWVGSSNGFLHVYFPSSQTWQYISDIFLFNAPQKRINALQVVGDTLFILSDIGVSVVSISKMEFGDTYTRFGLGSNQIVGNVTALQIFNGKLWLATHKGIASTSMTNANPSTPGSWQIYTTTQGVASNTTFGFAVAHDSLFAATSAGLSVFNGNTWSTVLGTSGLNIINVAAIAPPCLTCPLLYFITSTDLWAYSSDGSVSKTASGFPSGLTSILDDTILATQSNGLLIKHNAVWLPKSPPGPSSNKFVGLAVDERGIVWSGTGTRFGEGFMSFDGSQWKSYTAEQDSRLGDNNYYKVSIGRNNIKWVSNWGSGVALVDDQGIVRKVLNTTNGIPPTIDPSYIVVGGVATDQDGVAWITNRTGRADTALVKFHPDSSLSYVVGFQTRNPSNVFTDVVIDLNGTKWFSNYSRFEVVEPQGCYYYNEKITLPGTSNGWGKLTSADGLPTNRVFSVAAEQDGALWFGSDQGITIIFDPMNPLTHLAVYHPLRDQIIQAIVVDPINNKWIATKQGVFVLSPDGTSILDRYTVENTDGKLLDNDVASIAIDGRTGTIYLGTEKGLSSFSTTTAVTPKRSFDEISFTPNPFCLPPVEPCHCPWNPPPRKRTNCPCQVLISGLVKNSTLKILSIDGSLVKSFRTAGSGEECWDGTDTNGDFVATGIYLVVAYSEEGNQVTTGKLAVIKR